MAKHIAPFIQARLKAGTGLFIEPFVGGFNLVPAVQPEAAVCNDIHPGLYSLYQGLKEGTFNPPDSLSEDEYRGLKSQSPYNWDDPLNAFAAFGCSFGAIEWSNYAKDKRKKDDFAATAKRGLLKKAAFMDVVTFTCMSYLSMRSLPGDVIYADPPYIGTTGYSMSFDHSPFYKWCEDNARRGVHVLVSEFTAPDRPGWDVVWSKNRQIAVNGLHGQDTRRRDDLLIEVTA